MPKPVVIVLALSAALVVAGFLGCRMDLSACAGPPGADRSGQQVSSGETVLPLAAVGPGEETSQVQNTPGTVGGSADSLEPFGIVAPLFPGFGVGASSGKCDPFSDPYGTCI